MLHTPSLRQLRRNLPDNVAILPSAPDRQVKQQCTRAGRKARMALREVQNLEFPYKLPVHRERERADLASRKVTAHIRRTPEMLIALSVFGMMDEQSRRGALAIAELLAMTGRDVGKDALAMMRQVAGLPEAAKALAATEPTEKSS